MMRLCFIRRRYPKQHRFPQGHGKEVDPYRKLCWNGAYQARTTGSRWVANAIKYLGGESCGDRGSPTWIFQ